MKSTYSIITFIATAILKIIGINFIMWGLDTVLRAYVPLPKPILNSMYPLMLGISILFVAKQLLREASKD